MEGEKKIYFKNLTGAPTTGATHSAAVRGRGVMRIVFPRPKSKYMNKFFVWLMPVEGKILVTDIDMPPVAVFNIPVFFLEKIRSLNIPGSQSFPDWNMAVDYGQEVEKKTGWIVEYDNAWGREVEAMEDEGEFCSCDNCDLPDACEDFGCAIKNGIRPASDW